MHPALRARHSGQYPFAIRMEIVDRLAQTVLLVAIGELNIPRAGVRFAWPAQPLKSRAEVVAVGKLRRWPIPNGQSTLVDPPNTGKLSARC